MQLISWGNKEDLINIFSFAGQSGVYTNFILSFIIIISQLSLLLQREK